jgi:hypothetical protein
MVIKLACFVIGALIAAMTARASLAQVPDAISRLQWGLHNHGEPQRIAIDHYTSGQIPGVIGEDVRLPADLRPLGHPVTVAILDTGVDSTHPMIRDRLAGPGFNFVTNTPGAIDAHGHGTHVAGIILSLTPNARILPVKVVQSGPNAPIRPQETEPGAGTALTETVAKGIEWAVENNAQVINLSLAWPASIRSRRVDQAVALAESRGVLIVSSAGNDSTTANVYPCIYSSVICVGAHGPDGKVAYFSNFGPLVDILAPGVSILSAWPMTRSPTTFAGQIGYEFRNGTSMAAPFVAGALAELLARGMPAADARWRLIAGARALRDAGVSAKTARGGLLDLTASLNLRPQARFVLASKAPVDLTWDGEAGLLQTSVRWQNQGVAAARVEIELGGTHFSFDHVAPGESVEVPLSLPMSSQTESQQSPVALVNGEPQTVLIQIRRILSPTQLAGATVRPIQGLQPMSSARVRTVVATDSIPRQDLLFLESRGTDLAIQLVQGEQAMGFTTISARTAEQLLNPYRLPDGSYALVFLSQDAGNLPIFDLLYYDRSLNRLRQTRIGTDVTLLSESFRWARTDSGYNPLWVSLGYTPKADQPAYDPWNPKYQDTKRLRLYFVRDGQIRTLALAKNETPLQVLPDSSVLIARGDTYSVEYARLRVEGGQVISRENVLLPQYQMLIGLPQAQKVVQLQGEDPASATPGTFALTAPSSPGDLRVTGIGGSSFDRILPRSSVLESLVLVNGVFREGEGPAQVFAQTHYDLRFFGREHVLSTSLNRYSYIPSMIFNRNFFPATALSSDGRRLPAIYLAASIANADVSEVWVADEDAGRMLKPASLRIEARGCAALGNLVEATLAEPAQLVFVCGSNRVQVPVRIRR